MSDPHASPRSQPSPGGAVGRVIRFVVAAGLTYPAVIILYWYGVREARMLADDLSLPTPEEMTIRLPTPVRWLAILIGPCLLAGVVATSRRKRWVGPAAGLAIGLLVAFAYAFAANRRPETPILIPAGWAVGGGVGLVLRAVPRSSEANRDTTERRSDLLFG
jgi:peptidoglycan/LPS O-acetylase OafA/YrhL